MLPDEYYRVISVLLLKIRGTGAQEKELANLVPAVHSSPFSPKQMMAYTCGMEGAIRVLAQYMKNMSKPTKIQQVFTSSNNILFLTADITNEFVVC